jgi:uncharacterized protein YjbI with pentapeptide repeats
VPVRRLLGKFIGWAGWSKVASLGTALTAVAALYFSAQSLRSTEKQYGLSEQGQITDRFSRAIEQIGSDRPDVQLGGVYSLERLARDSPADAGVIFEVLSAYIRSHASSASGCTTFPADAGLERQPVNLQAALSVIDRRSAEPYTHIDLSYSCLPQARLHGAYLARAQLRGIRLYQADISNVTLEGAVMYGADLTDAVLGEVDFTKAILRCSNLSRLVVSESNLTDADLTDANLTGADLRGNNFNGASLVNANLSGAWLQDAALNDADLTSADLNGTDLSGAHLIDTVLRNATYDASTRWPVGFVPPPLIPPVVDPRPARSCPSS